MKFIVQVLAAMAFVAGGAAELQDGVQLGETFGGPTATTVRSITIRASDRVDAVSLDVADLKGLTTTLYHGGGGGDPNTLALGENEHIIGLRHTGFTTDAGNTISGGNPTDQIGKDSAPDGYQLGGFAGFCGDELDSVGAIWTSIKPVESPLK
ncbi:Jacalin-like lectin domain [Phytophthora cactorum]|nr:Jacalin-like lectin domain [Phytophthora cactorum]